jgi:hypothetical protein
MDATHFPVDLGKAAAVYSGLSRVSGLASNRVQGQSETSHSCSSDITWLTPSASLSVIDGKFDRFQFLRLNPDIPQYLGPSNPSIHSAEHLPGSFSDILLCSERPGSQRWERAYNARRFISERYQPITVHLRGLAPLRPEGLQGLSRRLRSPVPAMDGATRNSETKGRRP